MALSSFAQESPNDTSAETAAFNGIMESMRKTRQGGDAPTEADLKTRREGGMEIAKKARLFLRDYPASKNELHAVAYHGCPCRLTVEHHSIYRTQL